MSMGSAILIICMGIFVLLNLAVSCICEKEEFQKSWNNKKYIEAICNAVGFIMVILGGVLPKQNYLSFIGLCVIIVAFIIDVIGVARHMKDDQPLK